MAGSKKPSPPALSRDEARKWGAVGGKKSGEARRKRKALRQILEVALMLPSSSGSPRIEEIVAALIDKAETGDVRAFEVIRDTLGEKPRETVTSQVSGGLTISWEE